MNNDSFVKAPKIDGYEVRATFAEMTAILGTPSYQDDATVAWRYYLNGWGKFITVYVTPECGTLDSSKEYPFSVYDTPERLSDFRKFIEGQLAALRKKTEEITNVADVREFNLSEVKVGMVVKTRNGLDAKILATDIVGPKPVVAVIEWKESNDSEVFTCYPDGRVYNDGEESNSDLFLPKKRKSLWQNIYYDYGSGEYFSRGFFGSKEEAATDAVEYENERFVQTVEVPFMD